jgi:predicted transcriptional regulator
MARREKARVTGAELAVLAALWEKPGLSIRGISDRLYPGGGASEYATVQKLLERLEAKGCIRRDRSGFAHSFTARVERQDLIGREIEEVAEKLCGGSFTPILVHLIGKRKLSVKERDALRRMLEGEAGRAGD